MRVPHVRDEGLSGAWLRHPLRYGPWTVTKSLTNVCTFGLTTLQGGHLRCNFEDKDMAVHEDEMIDPVILLAEGRSRNQGLQARVFSTLASLRTGSESVLQAQRSSSRFWALRYGREV